MVSWREQPTRYDIEALQANIRRVGLVVRIRWALLIVLVVYSTLGGLAYLTVMPFTELVQRMAIPALALGFVVVYNTFYQLNYKRLGNIAVWNNLQLALDALVVTVLVYFSGSVNSWFWSMYSLFILEAAFILQRRRDAWLLAILCMVLLGSMELLELVGVFPHVTMPFASEDLYRDPVFVFVRYLWQVAVLAGTAAVATQLVHEQRLEESERHSMTVLDAATGLYSRGFFLQALASEIRRANRDGRPIHLIMIDIDSFGAFNKRFGIERGDKLLQAIAATITGVVKTAEDSEGSSNIAARIGGEEFAVLLAEDASSQGAPGVTEAAHLADKLRRAIGSTTVDDASVSVSVGIASLPVDASTVDELLDAADQALATAIDAGGNTVVAASTLELSRSASHHHNSDHGDDFSVEEDELYPADPTER